MSHSGALTCVDEHFQLLVPSLPHRVPWLKGQSEVKCIVEVVQLGLVRIWLLAGWAVAQELTTDEAEATAEAQESEPSEPGTQGGGVFLAVAKWKKSTRTKNEQRRLHLIKLPAVAILSLFLQDTGPMTLRQGGGTKSGKVALTVYEEFVELVGQPLL